MFHRKITTANYSVFTKAILHFKKIKKCSCKLKFIYIIYFMGITCNSEFIIFIKRCCNSKDGVVVFLPFSILKKSAETCVDFNHNKERFH